jgi:Peptidase family M1 domain
MLAALVGLHGIATADPLPDRANEVTDYRIAVTLNTETKQLNGRERLTWRNPSTDTVGDLWFHLYLNAFRNTRSTFFRESGGRLRDAEMPEDGWGWIDVTAITLTDDTDLKPSWRFEAPDDGNRDDRTVARVILPRPVGPGESVTLNIQFTAQLPRIFARTGFADDYFMVGQWFPKLGVYEPAGMRGRKTGGWNCHQFHGLSEFYADFGHYRVDITLPTRFIVGATGVRVERRDNGNGTATHVYDQSNVHDFAWTASPHFVEVRRRFVASREVTPAEYAETARLVDRRLDEVQLADVDVILLMQPAHMPQLERHVRAVMLAFKWFGLWYGRYPHRTLTVVDPADGAEGSGGMEYPTLFTTGTSARLNAWPFDRIRLPETIAVHEFGHQYWQGMVASNEFEEGWLDEGINSYSTGRVLELGYGRDATQIEFLGFRLSERDYIRLGYSPDAKFDAIRQPSWTYSSDFAYAFNVYFRAELVLRTLEHHVGWETMARIMRTYAERWRFRHPATEDFYAVANEVSGRDLTSWLSQFIDRGLVLDYEVGDATSEEALPVAGYVDGPKGRTFVSLADAERAAADKGDTAAREYDTRVVVRRQGEAVLPVEIAFKFEGKPVERTSWDGQARWRAFTFRRPERLEWVDIDPERRCELDVTWMNNARRLEPDRRTAVRLTSRWMFVLQQAIALLGM